MSEVSENILDEVGRELAGKSRILDSIPPHGAKLWEEDRSVNPTAYRDLDAEWEKRFGEQLDTELADQVYDGGDAFWYVMSNGHVVLSACDGVAIYAPPDTPVDGGLGALLKRFTALELERRQKSDRIDEIKKELAPIEEALREAFADAGLQNARCNGLIVFIRVDRFVSKKAEYTQEQVCEALERAGCGYMVKQGYNASSLKAKVAEWQAEGVEVPAELAKMLNVGEVARVASRK